MDAGVTEVSPSVILPFGFDQATEPIALSILEILPPIVVASAFAVYFAAEASLSILYETEPESVFPPFNALISVLLVVIASPALSIAEPIEAFPAEARPL